MNPNITIALSVIIGVVIMVVAKIWLHKIIKFKMDESAILNLLKETQDKQTPLSSQEIATQTQIETTRINEVCIKSQLIQESPSQTHTWQLK